MRTLKRPHSVEEFSVITEWPQSAIYELHRGLSIYAIRSDEWSLRWQTYDKNIRMCSKYEDLIDPHYTETVIWVDKLQCSMIAIPGFWIEDEVAGMAIEMNRTIRSKSPTKVFIQTDSYKLRKMGELIPEWTVKASLRYWGRQLIGSPIRWNEFDGIRKMHLSMMVNVGVLCDEEQNEDTN